MVTFQNTQNTKAIRYANLVERFKRYRFSTSDLLNPHEIEGFSFEVINPWELWQGNLDAEIMLVGQDFSDSASLSKNLQNNWEYEKSNPTNLTLMDFFGLLGYPISDIFYTGMREYPLYFTNAILGIKKANTPYMSKPVKDIWIKESMGYLNEIIDIVQPKYIIAMGRIAYRAICRIYGVKPVTNLKNIIGTNVVLPDGKNLFVVQHCSPLGQTGRSLKLQKEDWQQISSLLL